MEPRIDTGTEEITEAIIGAAFEVSNVLGHGFLEVVYQRALAVELERKGAPFEREEKFEIGYKSNNVGVFSADFVVAGKVIVELKAVERLTDTHVGQVLNYLKASALPVGLLLNFGKPKVQVRRVLAP